MDNTASRFPRFHAFALAHLRTFALAHFFLFLPLVSPADTFGPYTYTVTDNKATITGFNTGYSGELSITNELGGYPVTSIGQSAFEGCTALTSVNIPDSVSSIGSSAFFFCSSLASVTIGNGVISIGSSAFDNCSALASVTIGNGVISIGSSAFFFCSSLTSVTIPDSVTSIGDSAFSYCTSLTSVTIGNGVISIGSYAFDNCSALASVTIGNGVISIGSYAFYNCTVLTAVTIPDNVTAIGSGAFNYCESLTSIDVSANNLNYASFNGVLFNKNLSTLITCPGGFSAPYSIPDSVTSIGDYAFYYCTALTSVTIPDSVTSIGDGAFYHCTSLASINVSDSNPSFDSLNGVLFNKDFSTLIKCPARMSGDYTVPASVIFISDSAFQECTHLSSIFFLAEPPGLGQSVFGQQTLFYRNGFPGWGTSFGGRPTHLCAFTIKDDGVTIESCTISGVSKHLYIPASIAGYPVTSIHDAAFYGATNLTAVTIPDSVTRIGLAAFADCPLLNTVVLGTSLSGIGNWAFYNCPSLTKIYGRGIAPAHGSSVFGGTPATIYYRPGCSGWGDFYADCPTVLLPFDYTAERYNVTINAYLGTDSHVDIPQSIEGEPVTAIGDSAFEDCAFLESVAIPNSVQAIGKAAFCNCPLLSDLILPDALRDIGAWAFAGCGSLSALILPYPVDFIGDYAFAFCPSLAEIYVTRYKMPALGVHVFDWSPPSVYYAYEDYDNGDLPDTFGSRPASRFDYRFRIERPSSSAGTTAGQIGVFITSYNGPDTNEIAIPSIIAGLPVTGISGWGGGSYGPVFPGVPSLTSVTIPDSVGYLDEMVFYSCTALTSINVSENNPNYASLGGVLFDKSLTTLFQYPCGLSGDYNIPDSVTTIGGGTFSGCTALTSVTIGNSVTSIGYYAFAFCTALTSVNIPDSVTDIGYYAFSDCVSLASVTIPDSVTDIGWYTFSGCTALASILFTGDAPTIGSAAFDATPATIYHLPGANGWDTPVNGLSPVCWNPAVSAATPPCFTSGEFTFTLTGNANIPVRIEACDSLTSSVWSPVADATLNASGTLDFSDPASASRPSRFYRVTFPQ